MTLSKLPIKHPNEKRLEEALERMGKKKKKDQNKKKEITIPTSYRKIKKNK